MLKGCGNVAYLWFYQFVHMHATIKYIQIAVHTYRVPNHLTQGQFLNGVGLCAPNFMSSFTFCIIQYLLYSYIGTYQYRKIHVISTCF